MPLTITADTQACNTAPRHGHHQGPPLSVLLSHHHRHPTARGDPYPGQLLRWVCTTRGMRRVVGKCSCYPHGVTVHSLTEKGGLHERWDHGGSERSERWALLIQFKVEWRRLDGRPDELKDRGVEPVLSVGSEETL